MDSQALAFQASWGLGSLPRIGVPEGIWIAYPPAFVSELPQREGPHPSGALIFGSN